MVRTLKLNAVISAVTFSAFASLLWPVHGNQFLGKIPPITAEEMSIQVERFLLEEMEKELGSEHRMFTERRLDRIKHGLNPLVASMEKNAKGKLDLPAVSYVLRRLFLDRHAWFVKGLEPESRSFAAWNESRPTLMVENDMPSNVTDMFEMRFSEGMCLNEIAILAATLEHLVHKEALIRLKAAYASLQLSPEDVVSGVETSEILDSYMSIFILGVLSGDVNTITPERVQWLRANVTDLYPTFGETQTFLRDVQSRVTGNRDYYYFSDVMGVVEEVGDRYGRWQNSECLQLKDSLVDMEDKGVGGAGRVRLADFYGAALYKGRWEFVETSEYLKQLGALDDSDPNNLRVIIPNYINGPTNCVASTSYYAVCCIDECEGLLGHLEQQIGKPDALPAEIAKIVQMLPSSTVSSDRVLSSWLLHRLYEAASYHNGRIPLHGRLFAQWMHFAYPRECSYPHVMGATRLQRGDEYAIESEKNFSASEEEMHAVIKVPDPRDHNRSYNHEELIELETAMWTLEEELVVTRASLPEEGFGFFKVPSSSLLRGLMFMSALVSTSAALVKTVGRKAFRHLDCLDVGKQKYYV